MHEIGTKPRLELGEVKYLRFPKSMEIAVIAPYPYAEIRFLARLRGTSVTGVSVYLDTQSALGSVGGEHYWEIYPNAAEENQRFSLGSEPAMIKAIKKALKAGATVA